MYSSFIQDVVNGRCSWLSHRGVTSLIVVLSELELD